jgi:hypothetical protein
LPDEEKAKILRRHLVSKDERQNQTGKQDLLQVPILKSLKFQTPDQRGLHGRHLLGPTIHREKTRNHFPLNTMHRARPSSALFDPDEGLNEVAERTPLLNRSVSRSISRSRRRRHSIGPHGNATVTQAVLMVCLLVSILNAISDTLTQ